MCSATHGARRLGTLQARAPGAEICRLVPHQAEGRPADLEAKTTTQIERAGTGTRQQAQRLCDLGCPARLNLGLAPPNLPQDLGPDRLRLAVEAGPGRRRR